MPTPTTHSSRSSHRSPIIIALCSLIAHMLLLLLLATYRDNTLLPKVAPLIFAETPKPSRTTITLSGRRARTHAFTPSHVTKLGPAFAPPSAQQIHTSQEKQAPITTPATQNTHTTSTTQNFAHNTLPSPALSPQPTPQKTQHINTQSTSKPAISASAQAPVPRPTPTTSKTPSSNQKPPITLAELTSGFEAFLANRNGNSTIDVEGPKSAKPPTTEELVLERYGEKINYCIHKAHITNTRVPRPEFRQREVLVTTIGINYEFATKKYHLELISPSGDASYDEYCLTIFHDARTSFPPVPALLTKEKVYTIVFNIYSRDETQTYRPTISRVKQFR